MLLGRRPFRANVGKDSTDHVCMGFELQTPKPKYGYKIKPDCFFKLANRYIRGAGYDLSDGQEKFMKVMY